MRQNLSCSEHGIYQEDGCVDTSAMLARLLSTMKTSGFSGDGLASACSRFRGRESTVDDRAWFRASIRRQTTGGGDIDQFHLMLLRDE